MVLQKTGLFRGYIRLVLEFGVIGVVGKLSGLSVYTGALNDSALLRRILLYGVVKLGFSD